MSEFDLQKNQEKVPQQQNGSKTSEEESQTKQEKPTTGNVSDVGPANNTKEEAKGDKKNKTKVNAKELKAKAEKARYTIFPEEKMKQMEDLGQEFGEAAIPYIIEIGDDSWLPKVKRKALKLSNDINKQSKESGDAHNASTVKEGEPETKQEKTTTEDASDVDT